VDRDRRQTVTRHQVMSKAHGLWTGGLKSEIYRHQTFLMM